MLLESLGIFFGLVLLAVGADRFVTGAANIARNLGIRPMIIGLAIVGLATSMPEILVGSVAALGGKTEIAIGNAIGSNIANLGLVLGMSVLLIPVVVKSRTLRQEYGIMLASALLAIALMMDMDLSRFDAVVMLLALGGCIFWIVQIAKFVPSTDPLTEEFLHELEKKIPTGRSVTYLLIGLILLLGGSELLVRCAVLVAQEFGISDLVIGLTIIAVGTSLPELAASLVSVIKKEADIAVGNVIGSNMFNMLAVIGVPGLINPAAFGPDVLFRDFPVMFAMTLLMGWMVFIHGAGKFYRSEGGFLLLCFILYQYWLFSGHNFPA